MEDLHKEFQAQVIDQDVDQRDKKITYDLGSSTQSGAAETDMSSHPETRKESNGEFEDESGNMGRKSNETQIEHLAMKYKMIEYVIQHPFQDQVQATTTAIAEEFQRHDLPERRIEEVDDRGQELLDRRFYGF